MMFRNPLFFLALVPLVLLVIKAYTAMVKGTYSGRVRVPWRRLWGLGSAMGSLPPRLPPLLVYGISCAFFVIALARPQTSYNKVRRSVEGIDLMLVLDLS